MQSPSSFPPQYQSHSFYSSQYKNANNPKRNTQNLYKSKEEQINNLMKVNIIFQRNIKLFYEFYICQSYIQFEMITVLKQLCFENEMKDDIPSDEQLISGFMDIFVSPLYTFIRRQKNGINYDNYHQLNSIFIDKEIKEKLEINSYPINIKNEIQDIALRASLLFTFSCNELKLENEEKIMEYIDEFKSVQHHNKLKLKLLEYKSFLNELYEKYISGNMNLIYGYIRHLYNDNMDIVDINIQEIVLLIKQSFFLPFGSNVTNEKLKDLIYSPFNQSCGKSISSFLQLMINVIMASHYFLSHHSHDYVDYAGYDDLIQEQDWD